jgi:hypothetical protein
MAFTQYNVSIYFLFDEILLNFLSVFVEPSNGKGVNGLAHLPRIFFLISDSNDILLSITFSQRSISLNNLHHFVTSLFYSYLHTFAVSLKTFIRRPLHNDSGFYFCKWNMINNSHLFVNSVSSWPQFTKLKKNFSHNTWRFIKGQLSHFWAYISVRYTCWNYLSS